MRRDVIRWLIGLATVSTVLLSALLFQVREGQLALVTRLGKPVAVIEEAGLHWKLPWPIDQKVILDGRRRVLDMRHTEMLTRDKKNIILMSFAVWKIDDPLKFYQSIGSDESQVSRQLDGLITSANIGVLGRYYFSNLVSTDPENLKVELIENEVLESVAASALDKYGVEIEQIGFKRLSLPEGNIRYVFDQMRAERKQYAARFRAEGEREASKVRSETDLETARIRAEAKEQAARIRGEAEAEAAQIYAEAHSLDPGFYKFIRSLDTLQKVVGKRTTVVLRTDSEPFDLLKSKGGQ